MIFSIKYFFVRKKYSCPFLIAPSFGSYHDFLDRGLVLIGKLLIPWFPVTKLKSSLRKFYDRQHILVNCYGSCVSHMTTYIFRLSFQSTWFIPGFVSCLNGIRAVHVVHVLNLYDVISCNARYHVHENTTFESSPLPILL